MAVRAQLLPSRYTDPKQIGRGGMGEIYLAHDQVLGRRVAIKLLSDQFARDESVRRRFKREALAAARLSGHPHIVTIFDVGEFEGRPFIVMEYLSGGTLSERARAERLEHEHVVAWLRQAAQALDDAHAEGIVHRDVKPANLLLDERGELHVADFGIARVVDETTGGMTAAGTVLGTAGYLSPEQARGDPATSASDIYGLAVVAYELLTGGRPFEGRSATEEAAGHLHQPVPPASARGVGLPREVDRVFERALAKDPAVRYPTASDFVRELCQALEMTDEPTRILPAPYPSHAAEPPPREPAPVRRHSRRSRLPAVIAGLLLALGGAGAVLAALVTRGDDEPARSGETVAAKTVTREVTRTEESAPAPAAEETEEAEPATTADTAPTEPQETATTETAEETSPGGLPALPSAATRGGSENISIGRAKALNDEAFRLMQRGDYERALPLAGRALLRLRGTGEIYEAYASYNVGKSLIELGNCKAGLPFLDYSENIQGRRSAIDAARAQCS